ncbi:MAG TPA: hypothetical protein VF708_19770 [Pyrinomonadaceae bacterium]|jgi:hypothetical protein
MQDEAGLDLPELTLRSIEHYFAREGEELPDVDEALLYDYVVSREFVLVRTCCSGVEACFPVGVNYEHLSGLQSVPPYIFWDYPRVPVQLVSDMLKIGRDISSSKDTEALFHLSWQPPTAADRLALAATAISSGEGWVLEYPEQHATGGGVRPIQTGAGSSAARSIIEVHTHPFDEAAFSEIDDRDEQRGVKVYAVMGFIHDRPQMRARLGVYGHYMELPSRNFFELPEALTCVHASHKANDAWLQIHSGVTTQTSNES